MAVSGGMEQGTAPQRGLPDPRASCRLIHSHGAMRAEKEVTDVHQPPQVLAALSKSR